MREGNDHGWWDDVADELARAGVAKVFGLPGDDMLALGALESRGIDVVLTRSQRAAVFMALGFAAAGGGPAVVVVGRGPGAAGAVGALLEAATGSTGLLLLAGGSPLGAAHARTFQHAPQLEIVRSLCRTAVRVEGRGELRARVASALMAAVTPPAGVAYVEIPDPPFPDPPFPDTDRAAPGAPRQPRPRLEPGAPASTTPALLRAARRPVLLVGGGCRALPPGAIDTWARTLGAAIVCTASGRGVADESSDLFLGVAGLYLHPAARRLIDDADVVVALGSRLEETCTHEWTTPPGTVQVNVDVAAFDVDRPGVLVMADVLSVVGAWRRPDDVDPAWVDRVEATAAELRRWARVRCDDHPVAAVVSAAVRALPPGSTLCQENGLMDMWSYLFPVSQLPTGVDVIAPSEQTTLGFGCAAALGARHTRTADGGVVLVITGDGAAATVADELPAPAPSARGVVFVVLDNNGFGWLEQQNRQVNSVSGRFDQDHRPRLAAAAVAQATITVGDLSTVRAAVAGISPGEIRVVRLPCVIEDGAPVLQETW